MSIDMTQQALNALAAAGLGNDSPAEAYVIGYTQGHDDALALAIRIEQTITATPPHSRRDRTTRHQPLGTQRRAPDRV